MYFKIPDPSRFFSVKILFIIENILSINALEECIENIQLL